MPFCLTGNIWFCGALQLVGEMLSHVQAAVAFAQQEARLLGRTDRSTLDAQVQHFINVLPTYDRNIEESTALFKYLEGDAAKVFSKELRMSIASAVSAHMKALVGSGNVNSKLQTHKFQYNYWPPSLWDIAWSTEISRDKKFAAIIEFNFKIGLRFPDDTTIKQTIAMINAGKPQVDSNQAENYDAVHAMKEKSGRREMHSQVRQQ